MSKISWIIEVPLPGSSDAWYPLCICTEPANAAAVIQALLAADKDGPMLVRIRRQVDL
jgi:hypothetical protein